MHRPSAPCTLALALLLTASTPRAGNGAVGYALPARGIVADGHLDDWPDDLPRQHLELAYFGNAPRDSADLRASFRVAYEPGGETLFVAVEVEDESHQVEAEGRDWWNDDSCVLYFDGTHAPAGSGPVAFAIAGSRRELSGDTGVPWDPAVAAGSWDDATGGITREGTRTVYEFAVATGAPLAPGRVLGLDVVVIDLDEGEAEADGSYVCWGPHIFKNRAAGRCGAVVLVEDEDELGTLAGSTRWSGGDPDPLRPQPECVRVTSTADEALWLDVALDAKQRYAVDLPAGEYRVEPRRWVLESEQRLVRIADGAVARGEVEPETRLEAEPLVLSVADEPELFAEQGVLLGDFGGDVAASIDRFVAAWMDYYRIPGASLAVVHGGERVYSKTFGVANALTAEPVTEATLFEAASVTKAVFAFAVMRLAERGVIDLDRPLHLDLEFPALSHDERYRLLTPRIVLNHRSGLPNWGPGGEEERIDLRFTPGTDYGYSGEALQYLSRVVAHVDGRSVDAILAEEVLEPLGFAGATCFHDSPALRAAAARGHRLADPTRGNLPAETGVAHSMYSNAHELSAFLVALLAGDGLAADTYDEMLRFDVERPAGEIAPGLPWRKGFGLGFMLMESPHGLVFGHDGNNGDFRANLEAYRELGAGYVLFVNHSLGGALSDQLRRFLVAGRGE